VNPVTITPPNAMPIARNVVQRVDRRSRTSLATAPVLDHAAALLDAWCVTAAEHGADMAGAYPGGEWAERLAVVALEMAFRQVREPRPRTRDEATVLLDAVVARLAKRGVTTSRDTVYVPLARSRTTAAREAFESRLLVITIGIERGWELVIDHPTASPGVELVGRCDESGIDAMLDLADIVNAGNYGTIFHRRRCSRPTELGLSRLCGRGFSPGRRPGGSAGLRFRRRRWVRSRRRRGVSR
jgi:hypothetical protein